MLFLNILLLGDCHGTITLSHRYRMARLLIYRWSNYKLVIRACVLPVEANSENSQFNTISE